MSSPIKALLLTDVVGSTQLSESIGDAAMAEVWVGHDRAARDLLPAWGGREIDKTDGMLLMFDTAADAVGYALAYHRALAALPVPLQARAGLHVGPVVLRENSAADVVRGAKPLEVDGLAKPIAARVMSLANGGQTLLTPEALEAHGDHTALKHQSHGHWVMKGVSGPVELFEVGDDATRFVAPPDSDKVYRVVRSGERWLPVREIPNNLPQLATSFVGRERELDELRVRLTSARLITLLGMGGLGKTRLSLQLAAETMPRFPDGAWFIDLAPIRDAALVILEAARVLDVAEEPGRPLIETLCAQLKLRRLLLVVDNCEHLVEAAGDLIDELLRAVPQIRILASSREPLDIPGEQSYPIQPLPLPGRNDDLPTLARSTSVRLFVERAQSHRPEFELDAAGAPAVAELVGRLEGIPLAIELAAARMRTLDVAEINAGLAQRFQVLTGGSRRLQARQQTLRALVDWSYELLGGAERGVLDRLAVFAGGFDREAAQSVCAADGVDAGQVAAVLDSLADKSLTLRSDNVDGARWQMLMTIRDYAVEKLDERGQTSVAAASHCLHYFERAKEGGRGLTGVEQGLWIQRFDTERDNLRAATALALAGGVDPVVAIKIAVAMMGFWMLRGHASEGRAVIREALPLPAVQASPVALAWGLYVGAVLAGTQGEHREARELLERCLELRRGLGNPVQTAATLSTLALARLKAGDPAGATAGEREALELFRAQGDRVGEAIGLLHLGQIACFEGDSGRARAEIGAALAVAREIGHHEVAGEAELTLGDIDLTDGRLDDAAAHFDTSLAVCRGAADRRGEANAQRGQGRTALERGALGAARSQLGEALRAFEGFEMHEELTATLEDHVALLAAEGRPDAAVELAAGAAQARTRLLLPRTPHAERRWGALQQRLREVLEGNAYDQAWHRGRRCESAEAVRSALAFVAAPAAMPAIAATA